MANRLPINKPEEQMKKFLLKKVPPHNLEAEQIVLGKLLRGGDNETETMEIFDKLKPDDFYHPFHQKIFELCMDLYKQSKPHDMVYIYEESIRRQPKYKIIVENVLQLSKLVETAEYVSSVHLSFYIKLVREKAIRRKLIYLGHDFMVESYNESEDIEYLLDRAESRLLSLAQDKTEEEFIQLGELFNKVIDDTRKRFEEKRPFTGLPTGFIGLDKIIAGLQPSDLIIIAGRPGMGKTAFALNIAVKSMLCLKEEDRKAIAIFSLEMGRDQVGARMLCSLAKVDLKNFRTGFLKDEDFLKIQYTQEMTQNIPIFIEDSPAITTLELKTKCRKLNLKHPLGLVVVDYLQLMRPSSRVDSREQEIAEISRTLKALAKEMNIPVIALSQLNRKVEERTDKRPKLSDLRESGAIEQDADLILFLYRESVYDKKKKKKQENDNDDDNNNEVINSNNSISQNNDIQIMDFNGQQCLVEIAEVIVGKHRNGPTGVVKLAYLPKYTAFENLVEEEGNN